MGQNGVQGVSGQSEFRCSVAPPQTDVMGDGTITAVEGPKCEGPSVTGVLLEVIGSHHHGGGAQGVAGASEVVPLDAVEFPDVVAHTVVNPIEVGETTGIEPPT